MTEPNCSNARRRESGGGDRCVGTKRHDLQVSSSRHTQRAPQPQCDAAAACSHAPSWVAHARLPTNSLASSDLRGVSSRRARGGESSAPPRGACILRSTARRSSQHAGRHAHCCWSNTGTELASRKQLSARCHRGARHRSLPAGPVSCASAVIALLQETRPPDRAPCRPARPGWVSRRPAPPRGTCVCALATRALLAAGVPPVARFAW